MKRSNLNLLRTDRQYRFFQYLARIAPAIIFAAVAFHFSDVQAQTGPQFNVGERLTYNVSFERFDNVAYAELYTVSRGKLSGKDAVEIRSRIKTLDFVSAALYPFDESRITFASTETGFPLYCSKTQNNSAAPKETNVSYLTNPTSVYDLLTLIAKVRESGGAGTFNFSDNDKTYSINFTPTTNEKIKTDAGEFDTIISTVESEYLTENGIKDLKINLTSDDRKIPVMFRFKTKKGSFRATLSGLQMILPEFDPTPSPTPAPTPVVIRTPRPLPTPVAYIDNQPLSPDVPFELGESLDYQVSTAGRPIGIISLRVKERKQFRGEDSLTLTASVKSLDPGVVVLDKQDAVVAHVNPESLAPQEIEMQFRGGLSPFNQTAQFDQNNGSVTFGTGKQVEVPIGTQSIFSLLYSVRTFSLKPSKDSTNPVNDTRVAVFWDSKAYVFTLRPAVSELINLRGEKVSAQLITINTGNPQLDQLGLKVWLSNDQKRLPLRIAMGSYQADLISSDNN